MRTIFCLIMVIKVALSMVCFKYLSCICRVSNFRNIWVTKQKKKKLKSKAYFLFVHTSIHRPILFSKSSPTIWLILHFSWVPYSEFLGWISAVRIQSRIFVDLELISISPIGHPLKIARLDSMHSFEYGQKAMWHLTPFQSELFLTLHCSIMDLKALQSAEQCS